MEPKETLMNLEEPKKPKETQGNMSLLKKALVEEERTQKTKMKV